MSARLEWAIRTWREVPCEDRQFVVKALRGLALVLERGPVIGGTEGRHLVALRFAIRVLERAATGPGLDLRREMSTRDASAALYLRPPEAHP